MKNFLRGSSFYPEQPKTRYGAPPFKRLKCIGMKIFKNFKLLFVLIILSSVGILFHVSARAPEDLLFDLPDEVQRSNIIGENDVTYTTDQKKTKQKKAPEPYVVKTKHFVIGRSKPNRHGKKMEKIPADTPVLPFKRAHNERWIAVTIQRGGLKVWIPESILGKVDDKLFKKNLPPQEEKKTDNTKI